MTYKSCLRLRRLLGQGPQVGRLGLPAPHHPQKKGLAAILNPSSTYHQPSDTFFTLSKLCNYFFRAVQPVKPLNGKLKNTSLPSSGSKRGIFQKTPKEEESRPLPRLLYIQNPLVWVSNKLDFRFLRVKWDPTFTEAEFSRGARQAVSTVTQLLSKNQFDRLKPLFTKAGLLNLRRDVEIIWADEVRRNIGLDPQDVQLIIPRKLHFRQGEEPKLLERGPSTSPAALITSKKSKHDKKFCDIDVLFIALKYLEEHRFQQTPLCFVDIVARFHRNYSDVMPSDWTISAFKVRKFNLIPQKQVG